MINAVAAKIEQSEDTKLLIDALRQPLGLAAKNGADVLDIALLNFAERRHRVAPMLTHYLARESKVIDAVQEDVRRQLKMIHVRAVLREAQQKKLWSRLSQLFAENDIPIWGLKGQDLVGNLYHSAGRRWSKDIDALIEPHQTRHAMQLLLDNGYKIAGKRIGVGSNIRHFDIGLSKDALIYDPEFNLQIELHRRVFYAEPKAFSDVIRSRTPVGQFVSVNEPMGMLYTIIHGALDYWSRLKWLVDLSLLVKTIDDERLAALVDLAERFSCKTALIASLCWAEQIFAGSLAEHVAAQIDAMAKNDVAVAPLVSRFAAMLEGDHDYERRSLWQRPDFPTPAWHVFPSVRMRGWLCAYVPLTLAVRKIG